MAALGPACGQTAGTASDKDPGPIPQADLEEFAGTLCESIAGCCGDASIPFELTRCTEGLKVDLESAVRPLSLPNIRYDAAAARACIAAYAKSFDACIRPKSGPFAPPPTGSAFKDCPGMFVGTLPAGQACSRWEQCVPSAAGFSRCDFVSEPRRVCVAPAPTLPHGKPGEACGGNCFDSGDCVSGIAMCYEREGLQCDIETQTCQPLVVFAMRTAGDSREI